MGQQELGGNLGEEFESEADKESEQYVDDTSDGDGSESDSDEDGDGNGGAGGVQDKEADYADLDLFTASDIERNLAMMATPMQKRERVPLAE